VTLAGPAAPEIFLIVAVAENGVIGRDNAIPWRLKADQQRLREMTLNKPVVMGRKTFLSLKRPLPGRTNIVVTRDVGFQAQGALVATSIDAALAAARGDALRRFASAIAVIGGTDVYAHCLDIADRLEITEVHARPQGDTLFAAPDPAIFEEIARERHAAAEGDSADYSYVTYRRRGSVNTNRPVTARIY
jgi:dihydrofolate reductase